MVVFFSYPANCSGPDCLFSFRHSCGFSLAPIRYIVSIRFPCPRCGKSFDRLFLRLQVFARRCVQLRIAKIFKLIYYQLSLTNARLDLSAKRIGIIKAGRHFGRNFGGAASVHEPPEQHSH